MTEEEKQKLADKINYELTWMKNNVIPTGANIIILQGYEKTLGGLNYQPVGWIAAIGPDVSDTLFKIGQMVIFNSTSRYSIHNEPFAIVKSEDILAVLK